ncbi:MAG: ATP-binding protein [Thermoplasmata archaeon]|nr:MAG: ATP-binding protein [Thermoplasmata archaeon]
MKFFDRENELDIIRNALSRKNCFVVVTGRRRIGKTRLIREALRGTEHIELFIPRKRLTLAMESIRHDLQEQTGYAPSFASLRDVFEYLFRIEKKPVFIDEISNLDHVDRGAFADLQAIIDKEKDNWNVRLIVDGSYVGIMKKIFTDQKEPLFGRTTDVIDLNPLPVRDAVLMCMESGFGFSDALEAYSLLGGVPRYIELLSRYKDINDLSKRIFSPGSIFLTEGENILIQEFGASWDTYFSIMEVIARSKMGPSAIANQLGMPVQMLPKYLEVLEHLQLIRRKRPVTGKKRHVRYRIKDPFFQFWFEVCYPKIGHYRDGSSAVHSNQIQSAVGRGMERVILELLIPSPILPFEPDEFGGWWDRLGHEIDVLMYSKKERSLVAGEVRWRKKQVSLRDVGHLLDNLRLVDWYNDSRKEFVFIASKSGFSESAEKLMKIKKILGLDLNVIQQLVLGKKKVKWSPVPSE